MNIIFLSIVLIAFAAAGWRQLAGGLIPGQPSSMEALSKAMVDSAASAVELAIGLVGVMTLFLGLMKVAEFESASVTEIPVALEGTRAAFTIPSLCAYAVVELLP